MSAARQGKTEMVEALIQGGANVNAVDSAGTPVLFGPVHEGYTEIVALLLRSGAKVGTGKQRKMLLDAANTAQKPEIQKLLKGAS
jgi:ankyrin repeat protein